MGLFKSAAAAVEQQARTFSAPDVFENVGADNALFDEEDVIMTEPALSRINEPFEPQRHSNTMIEEEMLVYRGGAVAGTSSIYATGLINSSLKFQQQQLHPLDHDGGGHEDASDRDFIYELQDEPRRDMP